jgi:hypothetical protein
MTVADGSFGQPRGYIHWPGASSTWPFARLINVNGNRVGPPNTPQEAAKSLDFAEDVEYTAFIPFSMVNDDVPRIREIPEANTFVWARMIPIIRSALVCGVLALALASILCLVAGIPVIPGWVQGLFAMGGVAVGATIGVVRGSAA